MYSMPTEVKLLAALCMILCISNTLDLFSNGGGTTVVYAFSSPVTYQPRLLTPPTHDAFDARQYRSTKKCKTKLHEQPVKRKEILGPISASTVAKYNLPPDVIAEGWSAQIVQRAATTIDNQSRESDRVLGKATTEIQVIPKNPQDHYAGTVRVAVPIPLDSPGLGIELLEIEGGREDGLGITIVTGLVPGGNAEKAVAMGQQQLDTIMDGETIMYGDTIVSAEMILQQRGSANTDIRSIKTECLGYDSTMDALRGMLSSLDNSIQEASIVLTLKRLRRRPNLFVKIYYPPEQDEPPETIQLQAGDNLRMALLQKGIKLNDPLAQRYDGKSYSGNCGGGSLCRTCAVNVLRGTELLSQPKDNEKKMIDDSPRWRLSCKSWVGYGMKEGEIVIQVNPRQW
mmetsp:Transcript_940/g.1926  ORF Transcript_940/g.1926 Transcript_940/m.1926 type:complete len:399 (+) Transcript_940:119-1315(+)